MKVFSFKIITMLDLFRTLQTALGGIDAADQVREAIVFAAWRRIAGETLAEHAVPVKFDEGVLSVAVSNPTWQRHLQDLAPQMLFKLNSAFAAPTVSFIQFEIDEEHVQSNRDRSTADADDFRRAAEDEIPPELEQAAAEISDEALRHQFLLAAGSCLLRHRVRNSASTPLG